MKVPQDHQQQQNNKNLRRFNPVHRMLRLCYNPILDRLLKRPNGSKSPNTPSSERLVIQLVKQSQGLSYNSCNIMNKLETGLTVVLYV